jgi:hypothetical protein
MVDNEIGRQITAGEIHIRTMRATEKQPNEDLLITWASHVKRSLSVADEDGRLDVAEASLCA